MSNYTKEMPTSIDWSKLADYEKKIQLVVEGNLLVQQMRVKWLTFRLVNVRR